MSANTYILIVMPVPDQVRDDGSGIQGCKALKKILDSGSRPEGQYGNIWSIYFCHTILQRGNDNHIVANL